MKILLLSSYEEGNSAWSRAAQNMCRALDLAGADVVPRSYKLNATEPNVHDRVRELEAGTEEGCDVIFHIGLPHHFSWDSRFLNVGYYFTESRDYSYSDWVSYANLMDLLIVPNSYAHEAALTSGVKKTVRTCPVPMDMDLYSDREPLEQIRQFSYDDYLFYFIGDASTRKDLTGLLKAFYTEFTRNEPVNLVIKVGKYDTHPDQIREQVKNTVMGIQEGLRTSQAYSAPIIVTEELTQEDLFRLHATCDCLVSPSHGEAWGFNVLDAMGMGNEVITSSTGAFKEYSPHMVPSYPTTAFGVDSFPGLMTAHEQWETIDIKKLQEAMRIEYNYPGRNGQAKSIVRDYNLLEVGIRLKKIIEEKYENHTFYN